MEEIQEIHQKSSRRRTHRCGNPVGYDDGDNAGLRMGRIRLPVRSTDNQKVNSMGKTIKLRKSKVDLALRILEKLEKRKKYSGYACSICYGYRCALEDLGLIEEMTGGKGK